MKTSTIDNIGNYLLFQLLWLAALMGALQNSSLPALASLAVMLGWAARHGVLSRADMVMVLIGLGLGLVGEMFWLLPGLVVYQAQPLFWLPPLWILALWAGFALMFNHSLRWLRGRPFLCALLGASGGVLSLLAGIRMGAAVAPLGVLPLALVYAAVWALLVPLLSSLSARLDNLPQYLRGARNDASLV